MTDAFSNLAAGQEFTTAGRLRDIALGLQGGAGSSTADLLARPRTSLFPDILSRTEIATLGSYPAGLGAFNRTSHWANQFLGASPADFASIMKAGAIGSKDFDTIGGVARRIQEISESFGSLTLDAKLASPLAAFGNTSAKLAIFAGATDVLGPASLVSRSAYEAIMGGFNSALLDDRALRRGPKDLARLYRDLAVDDGLIEASKGETVALLVESGVVEGEVSRSGAVTAIVEAGPIRVRISAHRMRSNAFSIVDAFETRLRDFIAEKLEPLEGAKWFSRRTPGELVAKAKARRSEAVAAGETPLPLIHYLDLGDLISIIGRKGNWEPAFERAFDTLDALSVDLRRINSIRRPIMHARPVDPVRFTEIALVIRRLISAMEVDGHWDVSWDTDE